MFEMVFDFFETNFVQKNFFEHFQSGKQHSPKTSFLKGKPFIGPQKVPYKEALVTKGPVFSIIWGFAKISLQNPIEIVYCSVGLHACGLVLPCVVDSVVHSVVPCVVPWAVHWAVPWAVLCPGLGPCVVLCGVPWVVPCVVAWAGYWAVSCAVAWAVPWVVPLAVHWAWPLAMHWVVPCDVLCVVPCALWMLLLHAENVWCCFFWYLSCVGCIFVHPVVQWCVFLVWLQFLVCMPLCFVHCSGWNCLLQLLLVFLYCHFVFFLVAIGFSTFGIQEIDFA